MAAYTGTPRTWTAGETVTAALMNSDVRDPLAALAGAWTSYTPQVDQGASTNIAKTTTYAKYIRVGKYVTCQIALAMTGTGTSSNGVTVTLPFTAAVADLVVGSGHYYDTGTATYGCVVYLSSTTKLELHDTDGTALAVIGSSPTLAVANGDLIKACFTYEAA